MLNGTIKDYTISTLEELIERKIPRDDKPHKVSIHTYLNLHILAFKWDIRKDKYGNKHKVLYIEYFNAFETKIYKPMRSQFTKQTLWEIANYLYK